MALRLLLVDDHEMLRKFLGRLLVAEGLDVAQAAGGDEAWSLLQRDPSVDAILTDIVMPAGSGLELARRVRESGRSIKLLFMTGFATDELEVALGEFPEIGVLHKPFQTQDVVQALTTLGLFD